ncbi:hypothetical protein [Rudaea sp.]|uniref:hypothetical protein n=1 Tax=Rudaea sp. TaxID=2136325 RepID=UPI002ED2BEB7
MTSSNERFSLEQLERINTSVVNAMTLFNVLGADVDKHVQQTFSNDVPFVPQHESDPNNSFQQARRSYVRACYAFFEANNYALKFLSLNFPENISTEDIFVCREIDVDIDESGKSVSRNKNLRFLPNLRFAFSVFARAYRIAETPNYSDNGFADLRSCVKVRDRLTHPKRLSDLLVSPSELSGMATAMGWYTDNFSRIVSAGLKFLTDLTKQTSSDS